MVKKCGIILTDLTKRYVLLVFGKKSRKWGFPKGHMELGETEEETALRELREETGIRWTHGLETRLRFRNNIYFIVEASRTWINANLQICDRQEIETIAWFDYDDLTRLAESDCNFGLKYWIKRGCPLVVSDHDVEMDGWGMTEDTRRFPHPHSSGVVSSVPLSIVSS